MGAFRAAAIGLAAAILAVPAPEGRAEAGKLVVELNKFEEIENGCRIFFLFRNRTADTLSEFEMSLAILDTQGVIDRLLTVDAAPLPADRTTLKLFEIPEIGCASIGEVLLHEVTACRVEGGAEVDCFDFLEVASRAPAPLVM